MKISIFAILLFAGCSNMTSTHLPLRNSAIAVPTSIQKQYHETYIRGYEQSWIAYLKTYAEDVDHETQFMEDVASGDPNYLDGWFSGREDFEKTLEEMIRIHGKEETQEILKKELEKIESNQSAHTTPASAPR
ncbi:hypothetical protein [Pelagicoccus sp. SDUM812003]|uniref:hypothetical protein n=1 Tax=Pelagicoccus sp. SDUM812003 TaxID=3041267 RepID=UPI00280EDC71|nr:hypothetical protein [Pelagicoccus sp. SDUM812003]MDQ8203964.1 hypothetical protein [Pelagicoccus sp. SDUM812003]